MEIPNMVRHRNDRAQREEGCSESHSYLSKAGGGARTGLPVPGIHGRGQHDAPLERIRDMTLPVLS